MPDTVLPIYLKKIFKHIEDNERKYIERLAEVVKIPSVSAIPSKRPDIVRMMNWTADKLKNLGFHTELCDIGIQTLPDGEKLPLPPVLLAHLGDDPKKKTLLVYGHLDVQPANVSDGWNTDPFTLVESEDGKLFGRGSSDDKGPSIAWLNAVEAYQQLKLEIPVNLKFVFEGMEECGSQGLERFLKNHEGDFLKKLDCVCISDARWLGTKTPCITYGLRGMCYFKVEVECANQDLHSGIFGGTVHESMTDLIYLLNTLTDSSGNILIPGIQDDVAPVTDEEINLYKNIDFSVESFKKAGGCEILLNEDNKIKVLMNTWRYPSLSLHGIEGAGEGFKTIIPRKVIGKFSIRIVPDQDPVKIGKLVVDYLDKKWKDRGSVNNYRTLFTFGAKAWSSPVSHYNYKAARNATKYAYNVEPDMVRIGGSIPITLTFQEVTGKNVLVLPIGAGDDSAHAQNEKINITNYINGTKLIAAYMYEISKA